MPPNDSVSSGAVPTPHIALSPFAALAHAPLPNAPAPAAWTVALNATTGKFEAVGGGGAPEAG